MPAYEIDPLLRPLIDGFRNRRKQLGYTQLDVDRMTGWAAGLCGWYESGKRRPSLVSLNWWARALGMALTIETDGFPKASWRSSATVIAKILDDHQCRLEIKETGVPMPKRTEVARELMEAAETLSNAATVIASGRTLAQSLDERKDT
jgi:transcriptional regulator with XRE-family HTH domain